MDTLPGDIRQSLRRLLKRPAFTALAICILALGIGANTAIFSVINALLLQPLPYPHSDRLVQVWNRYPLTNLTQASVSIPDYLDRRLQVNAFDESALYFFQNFNLSADNQPQRVVGVRATASLFPLLGISPLQGRTFGEEEDQPGRENVVVISHGLWLRQFAAQSSVVGQEIRLNGEPHRIVGIMPEGFGFPHPSVEVWKPFAFTDEQRSDDSRGHEFSQMIARLKPGATIEIAQQEIDAIHKANEERFPQAREFWRNSGFGGLVVSYREELFGELRPMLLLLQGMVGFVLLIACANVANLLLTRVNARWRELSVRSALGASHWRLTRELFTESLLLGLMGGLLGILLGLGGIRLLHLLGLDRSSRGIAIEIDISVLIFAFFLSVFTGVLFGLLPIWSLWRTNPADAINESSRGNSSGRSAGFQRSFLVVTEIALAVVLLAGAALLGKSFLRLQAEDPGFKVENITLAQATLPRSRYAGNQQIIAFYDEALRSIRALPGVRAASVISDAPFSGTSSSGTYRIEGYTPAEGESAPHAIIRTVDPDYFNTMEIPLLRGRDFEESDRSGDQRVVVVDQILADKYFREQNPIGKRLGRGEDFSTIIGVVAPVKVETLDRPIREETIYTTYTAQAERGLTFVVRGESAGLSLTDSIRQAILKIDPEQPLYGITSMETQLLDTLRTNRVSVTLLLTFALVALILSSVGIYGVLAFSVSQRTREMGTRMALGAGAGRIVALILKQGLRLALAGIVAGVSLSIVLSRYLSTMLFGVSPRDPVTLALVCGLLLSIALLACYLPARRASRIDPMEALRYE